MARFGWSAMRNALLLVLALGGCAVAPAGSANASASVTGGSETDPTASSTRRKATEAAAAAATTGTCGDGTGPAVDTRTIDPFFTAQMRAANVPGLAVAVIGSGRIKWAKGYGLANIAERRTVTPDSLFMIASISKAVTAVALMQLIEDPARGLSLDQDVNDHLPFSFRNPAFPDKPITYRMLLSHTSGLIDTDTYWAIAEPTPLVQGDSPISLLDFDRDYAARDDSWADAEPGTAYSYSNTGSSVTGLLVETITGMNLQDYAKKNIFDRIGMKESSYFLLGLDPSHIAMPYDGTTPRPTGHYGYPDYPDGQLRTSANQLARFLLMFAQKGQCAGQRILEEETVASIRTVQFPSIEPTQGLIWSYSQRGSTKVLGHNGADTGVSTDMAFDPNTGAGYVILANGSALTSDSPTRSAAFVAMTGKLMELAKTLP